MTRAVAAMALVVLVGCGGGGSPSAPSTPAPTPVSGWPAGTVVQLVDGDTGAAVDGQVVIAGKPTVAGTPLAAGAAAGVTVDVTHAGYLTPQTSVRTGEVRLTLWPATAALPAAYTQALVYTSETDGKPTGLKRLSSRVHTVSVVPGAGADVDTLRQAVADINVGSVPAGVTYQIGGSGDFSVPVRLEPAYESCKDARAVTPTWYGAGGEIVRAEVVFCGEEPAHNVGTATHELGHTFGLRHSVESSDLMMPNYRTRSFVPTEREQLTMRLMVQRRAGTVFPDNDRTATAAAVRFEVVK